MMDELQEWAHRLLQLSESIPFPVRGIAAAALIGLLVWGTRYFSAWRQREQVRWLERLFTDACPKEEFAPHLRTIDVNQEPLSISQTPNADWSCPLEWIEKEEDERASVYYLRTGQRVSVLACQSEQNAWYGIEAWIREILAGNISPQQLQNSWQKAKRRRPEP